MQNLRIGKGIEFLILNTDQGLLTFGDRKATRHSCFKRRFLGPSLDMANP